jgi:signal transduction histidine kinase
MRPMNRRGPEFLPVCLLLLALLASPPLRAAEQTPTNNPIPKKAFLFSYYTGNGADGLHLAWSPDGYRWEELNRGESILKPEVGESRLMHDPYLLRAPDGTFHLLWTASTQGKTIGYASSKDLIQWSEQQEIPIMTNEPATLNCWAPETVWDEAKQEFLVFWASTVTNRFATTAGQAEGNYNHRLYCARTKDFKTFSPATLFYNPGFNIVDATMVPANGRFYLVFKDETLKPFRKQLRIAAGDHPEGPFGPAGPPFTRDHAEGPTFLRAGDDHILYFHNYQNHRYDALKSKDLARWEDVTARLSMPADMHHGSALEIPGSVIEALRSAEPPPGIITPIAEELGVGAWIWTTNVCDKQTCRLWHSFNVPKSTLMAKAILRITADNGYRVFLDGREIGRGGDWKYLTEYDLTWLLSPGGHVLAVEAFNDMLDAGVILGLKIQLSNGDQISVLSDPSWFVVSDEDWHWLTRSRPKASWFAASVVGVAGRSPWGRPQSTWWDHPRQIIHAPLLQPAVLSFWQQTWFLGLLLTVCAVAATVCVRQAAQLAMHVRTQRLLERERARIARDIHDDLGAGLTQLTLLGELILREVPSDGDTRTQVDALCSKARALLGSMDEIVWTVNPRRDTVPDFAAFVCQHVQDFLASTAIRCRLDIAEDLPPTPLDMPTRRNLFLAVKEAVRNSTRHSGASELLLGVRIAQERLEVVVEDNGHGFAPEAAPKGRNGLSNMQQRLADIGGACHIASAPGAGCRIVFATPLTARKLGKAWFSGWPLRRRKAVTPKYS